MRTVSLFLFAVGLSIAAPVPKPAKKVNDLASLEGRWEGVTVDTGSGPTNGGTYWFEVKDGKLSTGMSASESMQVVVDPGFPITQSLRDSVVCQSGLISKRALVETYGLTAAQADSFFANPTTVRLNVSGSSRFVDYTLYSFGLRIVGD